MARLKPLTLFECLAEAASWNRSDIRAIEEITPDLPMLKARKYVLKEARQRAREIVSVLRLILKDENIDHGDVWGKGRAKWLDAVEKFIKEAR